METSCLYNDNNICAAPPCCLAGFPRIQKGRRLRDAPVPVCNFRYYQYITGFGENKEVKRNKKPVKMYVENQSELSTAYKNSIYLKIV